MLGLWSGLGYYSRARNMHRCAQDVVARFGGAFPRTAAELETLPGIGRSTAAAIAAFCFGERVAILDGNVKRVLTRVLGFDADLSVAANERRLWDEATALLPAGESRDAMSAYTQGLMDLGATVCLGAPAQLHAVSGERAVRRPAAGYAGALPGQEPQTAPQRPDAVAAAGARPGRQGLAGEAAAARHLGRAVLPAGVRSPRFTARGVAARRS